MTLVDKNTLPADDIGSEFEGSTYGNTPVSFILVDAAPGNGPKLHSHPYDEIIIVLEGQVTAVIGERTVLASGGQIIVVPAHTSHSFVNSGTVRLRPVDIHASSSFVTTWL
jgi:mannose-6-phosphate isomerase-like protein (cupin superfamily)